MMYVTCTLSGIEDIADPRFRVIKFGDAAAQKVVVSLLRRGWGALPPVDIEAADDLDKAARAALNSWMSSAQNKAWVEGGMPPIEAENSDKDSVDTPWRMAVLYYCKKFVSIPFFLFASRSITNQAHSRQPPIL